MKSRDIKKKNGIKIRYGEEEENTTKKFVKLIYFPTEEIF